MLASFFFLPALLNDVLVEGNVSFFVVTVFAAVGWARLHHGRRYTVADSRTGGSPILREVGGEVDVRLCPPYAAAAAAASSFLVCWQFTRQRPEHYRHLPSRHWNRKSQTRTLV